MPPWPSFARLLHYLRLMRSLANFALRFQGRAILFRSEEDSSLESQRHLLYRYNLLLSYTVFYIYRVGKLYSIFGRDSKNTFEEAVREGDYFYFVEIEPLLKYSCIFL